MTDAVGPRAPTIDEFVAAAQVALGRSGLGPDSRLHEVCSTEFESYLLAVAAGAWAPTFLVPAELDASWATLADVHYYLSTHLAASAGRHR